MSGRKKEGRHRAAQSPERWVVQKRMVCDEALSLSRFEPGVNSSQATAVSAFPKCHCKEVFAQHKPHLNNLPFVLWSHFLRTRGFRSSYHHCNIQMSISHLQIPDLSRAARFSMGSSSFPASLPWCCSPIMVPLHTDFSPHLLLDCTNSSNAHCKSPHRLFLPCSCLPTPSLLSLIGSEK